MVVDVLINQKGDSFHNVYVYQITMYTLNSLQFYCQLYPNKAKIFKKKKTIVNSYRTFVKIKSDKLPSS